MRNMPVLRALALAILVIAGASVAFGELRRPTVREIDLLVALMEAETPVELWSATDGPFDRYRAVVAEREAAWSRQAPLQRRIERPEEADLLRREQRRRSEQLHADQRTLIAELRGAIAEAAQSSDPPIDGRVVDDLALWLEARIAGRLAEATRDGMVPPAPLPLPLAMSLPSGDRLSAQHALKPYLRPYITAAEAFFDAHLENSPAVVPTDAEHRVLPGFEAVIGGGYEARRVTAPTLVARSAAAHQAVLAALPESRRAAARKGMFRTLELNSHLPRGGRGMRLIAERVSGLDDAARQRLVDARVRLETMLAEEEQAAVDRLTSYSEAEFRAGGGGVGGFWERFREAESAYSAVAQEVLGDRFRAVLRAGWSSPSVDESVRALVDPDRFEELAAIDDPAWQLRRISSRRPVAINWKPTTTLAGLSTASRARLEALATNGTAATASLVAAADRHAERWRTEIEPEQGRLRDAIPGILALPPEAATTKAQTTLESSLVTLRLAIASIERELAEAIRSTGVDPLQADGWMLARAVELLAPNQGDSRLGLELLPTTPTVDAVIDAAGLDRSAGDLARTVGLVHVEAIEEALWKRQAWLDSLSVWMGRRQELQRSIIHRPVGDAESRIAQQDLAAIERRNGLSSGDPATLAAWDAIHADWLASLPEHADALRRAWLRAALPELQDESLPIDAILSRLISSRLADDPRGDALESLAAAHRAARTERALLAADGLVRLPISLERWTLAPDFGRPPDPRADLISNFRTTDAAAGIRTLRRAIAIVGVDASLAEPALLGAILRETPSTRMD